MQETVLGPPVALGIFVAIVYGLYRLGGMINASGPDNPERHRPYACGEDLLPTQVRMSYRAFFKLVLQFGILHLAALVISTLPAGAMPHRMATIYLIGVGVSAFVLSKETS